MLHNCALRVKSHFPDVDFVIASVKTLSLKNKTRRQLFKDVGFPPCPIVTRWGSWLEAAFYYAQNLPEIRRIVDSIDDDGVIVIKAKESLQSAGLNESLMAISRTYEQLKTLMKKSESSSYTVEEAVNDVSKVDFSTDPCGIKEYIVSRFEKNDILAIKRMENNNISPADYVLLLKCQPTSVSVERSFSMLGKLLTKDRNFSPENVKFYICQMYNRLNE